MFDIHSVSRLSYMNSRRLVLHMSLGLDACLRMGWRIWSVCVELMSKLAVGKLSVDAAQIGGRISRGLLASERKIIARLLASGVIIQHHSDDVASQM